VVLVVEDDQSIQVIVEEALSDGGFEATITASGEEAIALLSGNGTYRALVTDINLLGRLDGWEVARYVREMKPDFPIIYMSGARAADWTSKGVPGSIMLAKPFAPAQLVTAVSQLMNAAPPLAPHE
jgi:CheY-like chemotaxis protein